LHALFAALFGAAAPKPFAVSGRSGPGGGDPARLPVLAYSAQPLAALQALAEATAQPPAWQAVRWDQAADKPMPAAFPVGLVLGFDVRACPVVRLARGAATRDHAGCTTPGAEIDAYLAAKGRPDADPAADRQQVYRDWLRDQIDRGGGAVARSVEVQALRRSPVFRRGSRPAEDHAGQNALKRTARAFERPDVTFSGLLEVTEPAAFAATLARGVGRHRAFGFGMLLLRPA
jgi:CRISPR system Cascade subunit CasE